MCAGFKESESCFKLQILKNDELCVIMESFVLCEGILMLLLILNLNLKQALSTLVHLMMFSHNSKLKSAQLNMVCVV